MCRYCEDMAPMTPASVDVPGMDVEMFLETTLNVVSRERKTYLVISNFRTLDEAVFRVTHCPMCGRRLSGAGA